MVAESLKGQDIRVIISKLATEGIDLFVNPFVIKEIWRAIQLQQVGKKSTTQLTTNDIDLIYDVMNKFLSENFELSIPFPHKDDN